jgi:hypothetical protein
MCGLNLPVVSAGAFDMDHPSQTPLILALSYIALGPFETSFAYK